MLHFPPLEEIHELREIAHDYQDRGKEENYLWLMELSDRLQAYRVFAVQIGDYVAHRHQCASVVNGPGAACTCGLNDLFTQPEA